ncbi:hypothetical protein ACU045_03745 [Microbacterium sp. MAHUQ-60]|uniref:hypothetical protein n=1 Tax=unclassified Microbacterium TaxID=2609290 RepID=UPI003608D3A9
MPTRRLLQLAAFAAANVLIVLALAPANTAVALLNPLVYAATGSLTVLVPMTARVWSGLPGSAVLCAAIAGLICAPFSPLGFLVLFALVLPALVFDLVLWRARRPRGPQLVGAAAASGILIWAISLPIIDPAFLSSAIIVLLAAIRVLSYVGLVLVARVLSRRLVRAGVRPPAVREAASLR